jgi:hypothetical protein
MHNNDSEDDEVLSSTSSQREEMTNKVTNCDSVYGILQSWKKRVNVKIKVQ